MQKIDEFEVRGELGRGAMGVVYRAWDPSRGAEVAIVGCGNREKERLKSVDARPKRIWFCGEWLFDSMRLGAGPSRGAGRRAKVSWDRPRSDLYGRRNCEPDERRSYAEVSLRPIHTTECGC